MICRTKGWIDLVKNPLIGGMVDVKVKEIIDGWIWWFVSSRWMIDG